MERVESWDHFHAGRLSLDFANSVSNRLTERPVELFAKPADVASWAKTLNVVDEAKARRLLEDPSERAMAEIRQVRDALYRVFSAIADDARVPGEDLERINAELPRALSKMRLKPNAQCCGWEWSGDDDLRFPMWRAVQDAAELLTSDEVHRVKKCPECAWLFFDPSKNQSKRWCEMKTCGNRAKARRFHERHS